MMINWIEEWRKGAELEKKRDQIKVIGQVVKESVDRRALRMKPALDKVVNAVSATLPLRDGTDDRELDGDKKDMIEDERSLMSARNEKSAELCVNGQLSGVEKTFEDDYLLDRRVNEMTEKDILATEGGRADDENRPELFEKLNVTYDSNADERVTILQRDGAAIGVRTTSDEIRRGTHSSGLKMCFRCARYNHLSRSCQYLKYCACCLCETNHTTKKCISFKNGH